MSSTEETKRIAQKKQWFPVASVAVLILALLLSKIHSFSVSLFNVYNAYRYIPDKVLDHYIQKPLSDVSMEIPVYFDSAFKFPDLGEAVDIQLNSRMLNEYFILPNVSIILKPGKKYMYDEGYYPKDEMFTYAMLSDGDAIQVDGARNYGEIYFTLQSVDANDLPFFMTQLLLDHCYSREINKYTPDMFYQLTGADNQSDYFFLHADYVDKRLIRDLIHKPKGIPLLIHIHLYVVMANFLNLNIMEAAQQYLLPVFQKYSHVFDFDVKVHHINLFDPNADIQREHIDEYFPDELTDIPVLKDIYKETKEKFKDGTHVHMVFYPFFQGGDKLREKKVGDMPLFSEYENMFLNIDNWGAVYFTHIPSENGDDTNTFSMNQLQDCMWTFNQALLDNIGVPNEVLAPPIRLRGFGRYLTIQYLTYYSFLLNKIKVWKSTKALLYRDPSEVNHRVETFVGSLKLRDIVVERLKQDDTISSLHYAEEMLAMVRDIDQQVEICIPDSLK